MTLCQKPFKDLIIVRKQNVTQYKIKSITMLVGKSRKLEEMEKHVGSLKSPFAM